MTTINQESFTCEFCNKSFQRERTLINHLCENKRRWANRDKKYVRLGFNAWIRWHELNTTTKNSVTKSYKDFMKSKYYIAFTKFGRHVENTNMVNPNQFIDFVIKNHIKLDDWCKDSVYEAYVREVCRKEDVQTALERQVRIMESWADETGEEWTDFFKKINPNVATKMILSGRISPWILFNSKTVSYLFERMTDEQLELIEKFIDPKIWKIKMMKNKSDTKIVSEILEKYGI